MNRQKQWPWFSCWAASFWLGTSLRGQKSNNNNLIQKGMHTFRFDTFGDEAGLGSTLQLQRPIAGAKLGGVGPGVSPATTPLGLKVALDALPQSLVQRLKEGKLDLNDPAVTLALLKLNATPC
jgi:hypothetical protein